MTAADSIRIDEMSVTTAAVQTFPDVRVRVTATDVGDAAAIASLVQDQWAALHAQWFGVERAQLRAHPNVAAYRRLSQRIGIDPDKQPPSIQALVDRGLRDKPPGRWPRINPVVDAVNVTAVATMIALGVFDADRIAGTVRLTMSHGDEVFHPLGAPGEIRLAPGRLILADDTRVLSVFAHRDGIHQSVQSSTHRVLLLACVVDGIRADDADASLRRAVALVGASPAAERPE